MPNALLIDADLTARLRLTIARLSRRLRQEGVEIEGVSPSQLSALATVEARGPVTLGELAAAERVTPPTMTRIVAALEELGFVTRAIDPIDRRIARAAITRSGVKFLERTRNRKNAYLASRLRRLSQQDLEAVERALPILERLIEEDR